jgi:hypothetical protein
LKSHQNTYPVLETAKYKYVILKREYLLASG